MKETIIRAISGFVYISLLIVSLFNEYALSLLFFVFGIVCLTELLKLIQLKSKIPYIIFIVLYVVLGFWETIFNSKTGYEETIQILQVLTLFVLSFLIKDLFLVKKIPLFNSRRYLITTFYLSASFVFLMLIANFNNTFNPKLLLGCFILIWINDTFAFLVGKNLGKQKLFEKISPKKTVEGFLGGLFFSCLASYFIALYLETLSFTNWLIIAILISVFGTLGDLIESKFKRQANVKDSGVIMPGHGGLLDRLDSIIFAAPFIYLFLRVLQYVS